MTGGLEGAWRAQLEQALEPYRGAPTPPFSAAIFGARLDTWFQSGMRAFGYDYHEPALPSEVFISYCEVIRCDCIFS